MKEIIIKLLREIEPDRDFESSENFLEENLLDSFAVITFINMVEGELGICIGGEDISAESFKNLKTIETMLKKYVKAGV